MKANYVVRKGSLSEAEKEKIEKKLSRLDRFFGENSEIGVTVIEERGQVRLELTVYDAGTFYRAEQKNAPDALTAADSAVDVVEGQIRKYKTKLEKRLRAGAFDYHPEDFYEEEEPEFKITNIKHFIYKSMSPEEAVLQMNLLGHQFYVFKNEDNEKICVVYRRHDGAFGLIEPID